MSVVHAVEGEPWVPRVVREGDRLELVMGVDFNRGYDIREFHFPLTEDHLAALQASLARHLVLWCVLAQLAEHAGRAGGSGKPDRRKAARAIDVVLLGSAHQVDEYVAGRGLTRHELAPLVAHGGDPELIAKGRLLAALDGRVSAGADWKRVREHHADEARAERGVRLGPIDKALLRYTNRYAGWSGLGSRRPEQVAPEMLETVLSLVASAEQATGDLAPTASREDWESTVGPVLRRAHPDLLDEPIRAVAWLLRDEAPARAWSARTMPALADVAGDLRLHLYDAAELALRTETVAEAGDRPHVVPVGGELFAGVDLRLAFATYQAVTEEDLRLWADQQGVGFDQLLAAGIAKAEVGKHVARDGTCWISHDDLAAAALLDPATRATIVDPERLPTWPECRTLVPDGDLVIAPLSRLRCVLTGSRDEAGMVAILEAAHEAIRWGRDQISPHPLVWRHGQWLAFDWAAEFPHLADRIREVADAYADAWLEAATR